jgi:predicted PurR-regulated permease PerM
MTQASIDVVGIGNAVEGETVTPMLAARRITINPELDKPGTRHPRAGVLVLDVGVPGVILATPMLAITNIACDRIRPLMAFGHFIEG